LWLALNFWQYGDPLYFSNYVQARAIAVQGKATGAESLTLYLREMVRLSPLIFGLALAGIGLHLRSKHRDNLERGLYLTAWLLWAISLIVSSMLENRPSHLPARIVVTPLLLLAPWAGYALTCLAGNRVRFRLAGVSLVLVIILTLQLAQLRTYPLALTPELRIIARGLSALWHTEFLTEADQVLVERHAWDYLPLQVLSGHPHQVWVDSGAPAGLRVQMSPLLLADGSQATETRLRNQQFRLVVVHSADAVTQLNQFMLPGARFNTYTVFVYPEDQKGFQKAASAYRAVLD
jgi:hypothetical protein